MQVVKITKDDGIVASDGVSIIKECTEYFGKVLSAKSIQDQASKIALESILDFVAPYNDPIIANRLEQKFDVVELLFSL